MVHQRGSLALLAVDNGLGPGFRMRAILRCLDEARASDFVLVGVHNSTPLGTVATHAMQALSEGCPGFVPTNTEL